MQRDPRLGLPDVLCLFGILLVALATRLPGLELRGQWDADQGQQLLVMLAWVRDGEIPLVGPPTFAGTFHHGALYYWLLAPAAFASDVDPRVIQLEFALLGIATVAAVWALGAAVGGRWTGHLAGLLAAVSPALVLGSIFIWNPNPVPLGAAIALLGAVLAWKRQAARWWVLSAGGLMLAMQLHVSGALLAPPLVFAWILDLARRPRGERARVVGAGLAAALVLALGYVPLAVHELQTGFADTAGLARYLASGAGVGASGDILTRLLVVVFRSLAWPFVGVVTEAAMAAAAVTVGVVLLIGVAFRLGGASMRPALLLFVGVLAWSVPALAVTAPTLLAAVPGLPNDHYHTYLDPLVIVAAAAGLAALGGHVARVAHPWDGPGRVSTNVLRRGIAGLAAVALVGLAVSRWPAASSPDGGWPLADEAAGRLIARQDVPSLTLVSLPEAKLPDAIRFPLERRGAVPLAPTDQPPAGGAITVCDPLFEDLMGAACGGGAEQVYGTGAGLGWPPLDLFTAGERRVIGVLPAPGDEAAAAR